MTPAGLPDYRRRRLPAIPTPTINAPTGDRPAASRFTHAPTGFAFHSQARPATADRIQFTADNLMPVLCFGLVVLVPLLSTPPRSNAVTVQFCSVLHRSDANSHPSVFQPSQAHERGQLVRELQHLSRNSRTSRPHSAPSQSTLPHPTLITPQSVSPNFDPDFRL